MGLYHDLQLNVVEIVDRHCTLDQTLTERTIILGPGKSQSSQIRLEVASRHAFAHIWLT